MKYVEALSSYELTCLKYVSYTSSKSFHGFVQVTHISLDAHYQTESRIALRLLP